MSQASKIIAAATAIATMASRVNDADQGKFLISNSVAYDPRYKVPDAWNKETLVYLGQNVFPTRNASELDTLRQAGARIVGSSAVWDFFYLKETRMSQTKRDAEGQPAVSTTTSFVAIAGTVVAHGYDEAFGGHLGMTAARAAAIDQGFYRCSPDNVIKVLTRKMARLADGEMLQNEELDMFEKAAEKIGQDPAVLAFKREHGIAIDNINPHTDFVGRVKARFANSRRQDRDIGQMVHHIMLSVPMEPNAPAVDYDQALAYVKRILGLDASSEVVSNEVVQG